MIIRDKALAQRKDRPFGFAGLTTGRFSHLFWILLTHSAVKLANSG